LVKIAAKNADKGDFSPAAAERDRRNSRVRRLFGTCCRIVSRGDWERLASGRSEIHRALSGIFGRSLHVGGWDKHGGPQLGPLRWITPRPAKPSCQELGFTMRHYSLRHATIVAIAFLLASTACDSLPLRAADPQPTAHEAAILDRTFTNWKARHDRVRSLHFTWDYRTTFKKGSLDFASTATPRPVLKHDQVFERFGAQLWIEGDDRLCLVLTPGFKVPQAKLKDIHRVVIRRVIVGKSMSTFSSGALWETGEPAPGSFAPRAEVYPCDPDSAIFRSELSLPLFPFRAQTPFLPWQKKEFRVLDENASIDNGRYLKLQRIVEPRGVNAAKHDEFYWVSPGREDAVVHCLIKFPLLRDCEGSIKFKRDPTHDWVPSEWTLQVAGVFEECKLTDYSINEKIDPAVFADRFPPGTPVKELLGDSSHMETRCYIVEPDGSKRSISPKEYLRLVGLGQRAPKADAGKPQGK
jgi:hypothetical protein